VVTPAGSDGLSLTQLGEAEEPPWSLHARTSLVRCVPLSPSLSLSLSLSLTQLGEPAEPPWSLHARTSLVRCVLRRVDPCSSFSPLRTRVELVGSHGR
jgi:hypothetical protein